MTFETANETSNDSRKGRKPKRSIDEEDLFLADRWVRNSSFSGSGYFKDGAKAAAAYGYDTNLNPFLAEHLTDRGWQRLHATIRQWKHKTRSLKKNITISADNHETLSRLARNRGMTIDQVLSASLTLLRKKRASVTR